MRTDKCVDCGKILRGVDYHEREPRCYICARKRLEEQRKREEEQADEQEKF